MPDVIEASETGVVYIREVFETRQGPKAALQGDTYEAFVEDGLKAALPWEETHRSFDYYDNGEWTVDANQECLELVREEVEERGYSWGGVTAEVVETVTDEVELNERMWRDVGVSVTVTYESMRAGGSVMVKDGIVTALQGGPDAVLWFVREDDTKMRLSNSSLYTSHSEYPYVGDVVDVVIKYDVENNHATHDEELSI